MYLCGQSMSVADIIAVITVDHLELVQSTDEYPKIKAWMKRMKELPYYNELNGQHVIEFKQIVINSIEKNNKGSH